MSSVSFCTRESTAKLSGSERAYLYILVAQVGASPLAAGGYSHELERMIPFLVADKAAEARQILHRRQYDRIGQFLTGLHEAVRYSIFTAPVFALEGKPLNSPQLTLNTAVRLGNDQVQLAARIWAQCEIHGWFPEEHRLWAADIMERGVASGLYRDGRSQGWQDVIDLLRNDEPGPVVMSYSVTDGICEVAPKDSGYTQEEWCYLPRNEQWELWIEGLKNSPDGLEITPETLPHTYGHDVSLVELIINPEYLQRKESQS